MNKVQTAAAPLRHDDAAGCPVKIVIAIDSFKGCLSSAEAGAAAAEGMRQRWPEAEVVCLPVSDGGEGWLDAFGHVPGRVWETMEAGVSDPLMRPVTARYLKGGKLAVIEIAEACGLHLLQPGERNPLTATSRGVGELIADAVQRGCTQFIVGLGGSAVSDAGRGMMEVLKNVRLKIENILIATDVTNPLCGPKGAAAVFGPQKGATAEMVQELDRRAQAYAAENARRMGYDRSGKPGAGAAGGLGYAFMQFLGAEQRSGGELLLEMFHFDELIRDADLVITGEGRADRQTLMGKLPAIVLRHARQHHIPCHLLAGQLQDKDALLNEGFASVRSINPPQSSLRDALQPEVARQRIKEAAAQLL